MSNVTLVHILCVEDNAGDRLLIKRFFAPLADKFHVHFLEDGVEALDFAYKRGKYTAAPTPELVILDLNLQRVDGKGVLANLKKSDQTKQIPIFILTTSKSFEDKRSCLALGAEQFFSKPSSISSFEDILRYIKAWLEEKKIGYPKEKPPTIMFRSLKRSLLTSIRFGFRPAF
jgi:CheY-like chemotaxis protein